jgi:hypothetical protein
MEILQLPWSRRFPLVNTSQPNSQMSSTTGLNSQIFIASRYIDSGRTSQKTCRVPECVFIGPLQQTGQREDHIESTFYEYFGRCLEMVLQVTIY